MSDEKDEKPGVPVTLDVETGTLGAVERAMLVLSAARRPEEDAQAPPVPAALMRLINPNTTTAAYKNAFELIGGVPAFALWADRNRDAFYRLHSKLLPTQITGEGGEPVQLVIAPYADNRRPEPPPELPDNTDD